MGGYGPTTVNLHDVFHVVEDGVVTDIWPVAGAARHLDLYGQDNVVRA